MSALGSKLRSLEGGKVAFLCPSCQQMHHVTVDGSRGWTFNGDGDKPTFSPSILVRSGHHMPDILATAGVMRGTATASLSGQPVSAATRSSLTGRSGFFPIARMNWQIRPSTCRI